MHQSTAIMFKNVSYKLKKLNILENISGEIIQGQITTLVGPSGAGKSTLLKLCNGLISPTDGEIMINGKPIHTYHYATLRRKVGIVLQHAPMIDGTVYDNLALPKELQGQRLTRQAAGDQLQLVGLSPALLDKQANDLSGGEKQRVSIARTLQNESSILLLDEITSALDPQAVADIEQLILRLNTQYGITIIWITHQLEQALRVADNAWILDNGKLIQTGTNEILTAGELDQTEGVRQ